MRIGGKIGQNGTEWGRVAACPSFEASRGRLGPRRRARFDVWPRRMRGNGNFTSMATFRKGQRLQVNSSRSLELRGLITRLLELGETVLTIPSTTHVKLI